MKPVMIRTTFVIRADVQERVRLAKALLGLNMADLVSDACDKYLDDILVNAIDAKEQYLKEVRERLGL